jgi:hypothetical protein
LAFAGHDFITPPSSQSQVTFKSAASSGAARLNARTAYFYVANHVSPASCMRIPGIGVHWLVAVRDSEKNFLDGGNTYKLTLPKGIPQGRGWSVTVYDNQTRSMLATSQRCPKIGSQDYPRPAAVAGMNGATVLYFGPKAPAGEERNWVETVPGKGWFAVLRIYEPQQSFFKKEWRPGEFELVK